MLKRLQEEKRDNNFGKDKQTQDRLLERLDRYQNKMIHLGAISVDAIKPIDDVMQDILSQTA